MRRGRLDELWTEVRLDVLGARQPDTVLGGERASEPTAQIRHLVGDLPQLLNVLGTVQIEYRPDMEFAGSRVTVERGLEPERLEDLGAGLQRIREVARAARTRPR